MNRWESRFLILSNLLVGGTGVVYAIMRYFMQPADEWAVVNHPWQPHVQHLHVLAAPLLVFACGLIWHRHVVSSLRGETGRGARTGPGLLLAFGPMVLSGYMIQTTTGESWRQLWVVVHVASSAAWMLAFADERVILSPRSWTVVEAVRLLNPAVIVAVPAVPPALRLAVASPLLLVAPRTVIEASFGPVSEKATLAPATGFPAGVRSRARTVVVEEPSAGRLASSAEMVNTGCT